MFAHNAVDFGQGDGERVVLEKVAEVVEGQGDGLEEVILALEEATVAVGSEGLEDADEEVGPEEVHPLAAFIAMDIADIEVVSQQLATDSLGEVAFGAVEQRGDIILRGTSAAALEINVVKAKDER